MAYITYSDVQTFLEVTFSTAEQNVTNPIIAAVEKFIEDKCNRKWSYTAITDIVEYFDGNTNIFFLKQVPIASIQEITVDGSVYDPNYVYNYEHYIKTLHELNPAYPRGVKITYRTSANSIPNDLKHAIVRWVAEVFKSHKDAGKTIGRLSVGSISIDFLTQDGIPKYVQMLIDKYRLSPGL